MRGVSFLFIRCSFVLLALSVCVLGCPMENHQPPAGQRYDVVATNPADGAWIFVPSTNYYIPFRMSAETPGETKPTMLRYYVNGNLAGTSVRTSLALDFPALPAIGPGTHTVSIEGTRAASPDEYLGASTFSIGIANETLDATGDGMPGFPFELLQADGDQWFGLGPEVDGFQRAIALARLEGVGPGDTRQPFDLSLALPEDPTKTVRVQIPRRLIRPRESALVMMILASSVEALVGGEQVDIPSPSRGYSPRTPKTELSILVTEDDGANFTEINNALLQLFPPRIAFEGFGFSTAPTRMTSLSTDIQMSPEADLTFSVSGAPWAAANAAVGTDVAETHASLFSLSLFAFSGISNSVPLDIGDLGGVYTIPLDMNEAGDIVGYSYLFVSANEREAFHRSAAGVITGLGTLGRKHSYALGLNDNGQVVGYEGSDGDDGQAFIWDSVNGMQALPTLGGALTVASDINDAGLVAGYGQNGSGNFRAFVWDSVSGIQDLGTLGGNESYAHGVNDFGFVVGEAQNASVAILAFFWDSRDGMRDLGTLGGTGSFARAMSNANVIVGGAETAGGEVHAFRSDSMVYYTDFEATLPLEFTASGWAVETMDSGADGSFGTNGFSADQFARTSEGAGTYTLTLSLTGLPAHTGIDLNFLLASIDMTTAATDTFSVSVDSNLVFSEAIDSGNGGWQPGAPIELFRDLDLGYATALAKDFNFGPVGAGDHTEAVDFSNIPHSAATLEIEFQFVSGGATRSLAIDDLSVVLVGDGGLDDLSTLGGTFSEALGVNDNGVIVGRSTDAMGADRAFVWDAADLMDDVNDLVANGTIETMTRAWAINTAGQLLAEGQYQSAIRGYLLE